MMGGRKFMPIHDPAVRAKMTEKTEYCCFAWFCGLFVAAGVTSTFSQYQGWVYLACMVIWSVLVFYAWLYMRVYAVDPRAAILMNAAVVGALVVYGERTRHNNNAHSAAQQAQAQREHEIEWQAQQNAEAIRRAIQNGGYQ